MSGEAQAREGWGELLFGPRAALVWILLLGVWMNAADTLVTVALMPSVARSIGGYAYFAWAAGAFMLGGIVSCASGGHLAARLGLKRGLIFAAGLYGAGCVVSAAAPGVAAFLVGRLAQGIGGGWLVALVFVAVGVAFPERMAGRMISAFSGVWGAATLLGPLLGGGFATLGLWRWVFWVFALQALVFIAGVAVAMPRQSWKGPDRSGAPWLQLLLIGIGVFGIAVAGVVDGAAAPLSALAGLIVLVIAVAADRRAPVRILPQGVSLRRPMGLGYVAIFLYSTASTPSSVYSPILLQQIHHVSPLTSGYAVACEAVGWSSVAVLVGGAGRAWQARLIRIGGILAVCGLMAIAASIGWGPVWSTALATALMGAGFGCAFAFTTAWTVEGTIDHDRALASAAIPTLQYTGNCLGAVCAGILARTLGLARPFDPATGTAAAAPLFLAFLPIMALGAVAAWRLVETSKT